MYHINNNNNNKYTAVYIDNRISINNILFRLVKYAGTHKLHRIKRHILTIPPFSSTTG